MSRRLVQLLAVSFAALVLALTLHLGENGIEPGASAAASASGANTAVPRLAQPAPAPRGAAAQLVRVVPQVTLPNDSPWALPPVLVLQSRAGGRASLALR